MPGRVLVKGLLAAVLAALIAGATGFYAGLLALLAVTGLEAPGWAPVVMLTGAGLFASIAASLVARVPGWYAVAFAAGASAAGAALGGVVRAYRDSFDAAIVAGVLLVLAVALTTHAVAARTSAPGVSARGSTN